MTMVILVKFLYEKRLQIFNYPTFLAKVHLFEA
jgi:hypothetical protein